jgi:hypothetical protein
LAVVTHAKRIQAIIAAMLPRIRGFAVLLMVSPG